MPRARYNEVVSFINNNNLEDLCISRPRKRLSWGVDFPIDKNYVVYVWFDALLNYISAAGYSVEPEKFKKLWPADIHFMAKDILRYHAVYWPIMLHALGLNMPRRIFAHGWWKFEGEKISKSRGNIVNPLELISHIGVDALRYFLLREVPAGLDGSFSWKAIVNRANSDLSNDLGNLVYRTLTMTEKYFDGKLSPVSKSIPPEFEQTFKNLKNSYASLMENAEFSQSLEAIFKAISVMNKYIEDKKPWIMRKEKNHEGLRNFMYVLLEGIRIVSLYLYPFMPQTTERILRQLGKAPRFLFSDAQWAKEPEYKIKKESPLFPRIENDK